MQILIAQIQGFPVTRDQNRRYMGNLHFGIPTKGQMYLWKETRAQSSHCSARAGKAIEIQKGAFVKKALVLLGVVLAFASCQANAATYTYVGSWEVDQGPSWTAVPPAYTGQDAAALLFGGTASDYVISTNGTDPSQINFEDWVSTWGGAVGCGEPPCGTLSADDFVVTEDGFYQTMGDTSSYVSDWATGSQFTNYAFEVGGASPVPEPGTWLLMGTGLLGLALVTFRRKSATRRLTASNLA